MFEFEGVPIVPYTPEAPHAEEAVQAGSTLLPAIQAHSPVDGLYSHRSLSNPPPMNEMESSPSPPKSQRLPLLSVQVIAHSREPG